MDDVRTKFAGVPLFDQNLNEELLALERRQFEQQPYRADQQGGPQRFFPIGDATGAAARGLFQAGGAAAAPRHAVQQPTAVYPVHRNGSSPLSVDLSPSSSQSPAPAINRARELFGRPTDATFALPPKIMRPWSVEVLMRRGDMTSSNLRHSQFDADNHRAPLQSRLTNRRGGVRGHQARGGDFAVNNEQSNNIGPAGEVRTSRRYRDAAGNSPNAADNSSPDDDYRRGALSVQHGQHPADVFFHGQEPLTTAVEQVTADMLEDLDDFTLNEQIERAATRRRIQEERLGKLGLHPPGMVVVSEQQTNARDLRFEPDSHGVPTNKNETDFSNVNELLARIAGASASHASTGTGSSPPKQRGSEGMARHTAHSKAPLVLDAMGYREYTTPTEAAAGDTIWRRMLMEEKNPQARPAGTPSAYSLAKQSTAGTQRSHAADIGPHGGHTRELAVSHNPSQVHSTQPELATSMFDTKTALMRQLDQMQLSNEEMLVKNKIVSLSSASDAFRNKSHRALDHVAAAQRSQAAALAMPAPEGGYQSVTQRLNQSSDARAPDATSDSRWSTAALDVTLNNVGVGSGTVPSILKDGIGTTPLRRWATDHSNLVPSTTHQSTLPRPRIGGAAGPGSHPNFVHAPNAVDSGYDARKKWSGVSFQTQVQDPFADGGGGYRYYGPGGDDGRKINSHLEALSESAADYMHPDPASFTGSSTMGYFGA
jgi:hypothetical protein